MYNVILSLKLFSLVFLIFGLTNCMGVWQAAPNFNRISVGMTKAEVIKQIGKPRHASASGGSELLAYEWDNFWDGKGAGMWSYVGLENGRVVGYHTDYLRQSTNFNVAAAWAQINSAPRTNIQVQQNNTAIRQSQANFY
jgi:hypothetical protein